MTAVVDDTDTTLTVEVAPMNALAPWRVRAAALGIDTLPGAAVLAAMALTALMFPLGGVWWWLCVVAGGLAFVLTAANRTLLPAVTGWSLGRALFGVAVVRGGGASTEPVGPWRLLIRDLAHLLDTASMLVGWLWPLLDERRRTFADMLLRTEVRQVDLAPPLERPWPQRKLRRVTAVIVVIAALLCAAGATAGYLVAFRHDQAVKQARAQIGARGPKIVEQMLTYNPASLQDDFVRAQSLVTDKYREQLVVQQQEVLKRADPLANQYWVINSAVLSATPDRAAMLLFLQGERDQTDKVEKTPPPDKPGKKDPQRKPDKKGAQDKSATKDRQAEPPKSRMITATVRVAFVRSAPPTGSPWLIDDLTVLTKPLPPEEG